MGVKVPPPNPNLPHKGGEELLSELNLIEELRGMSWKTLRAFSRRRKWVTISVWHGPPGCHYGSEVPRLQDGLHRAARVAGL